MNNEDTKLMLIKALIEGIRCNFKSIDEIAGFIDTFKDVVKDNDLLDVKVIGDPDGLLVEDKYGMPFCSIIVSGKRIKFSPLVAEELLVLETAESLSRIVLATFTALIIEEQKNATKVGEEITSEFASNGFGIIE